MMSHNHDRSASGVCATGGADHSQPLRAILDSLVENGARYDAEPHYPRDSVEALAEIGAHLLFASPESGGEAFRDRRAENATMMTLLRLVGRADLSLGRIFEGHVNALKLFDWYGSAEQKRWLGQRLGESSFFGVWATEPPPGVRLSHDGRGWLLSGAKAFATGAGGLAHAVITARREDGETQLVVVPADDAERADLSQWRVRGMRATGSGRYDVTDMRPEPIDLLGAPGDYGIEPDFTAGAWRFLAVQLGGVEALVTETRQAMSEAARGDPLQRAKFADAVAAARTAFLWVREAADRAAGGAPDAVDFVRMARGVVERAALDVMELSARIIGTRSAFDDQRIDKITRDLSLYLRQAGPDHARDRAALAWLDHDVWGEEDRLW